MAVAGKKLKVNGGAWVDHIIDVGMTSPYLVTGLDPSTSYAFQQAAYDDALPPNQSAWGTVPGSPFTTDAAPASPISLIAHAIKTGNIRTNTTAAINTTGATRLEVAVTYDSSSGGFADLTDSKSNTWTVKTIRTQPSHNLLIYECKNPTVGSGHTFTAADATHDIYGSVAVAAFDNTDITVVGDGDVGNTSASATTLQPGSLTPANPNSCVFTAVGFVDTSLAGNATIDSGFTVIDSISHSANIGLAIAYKDQTTAVAVNPTWTAPAGAAKMEAAMTAIKHS